MDSISQDVRAQRSRALLVSAMLDLVREGCGEPVTISALCTRAAVSRPTFYQHFTSTESVLASAVRRRLDEVRAGLGDSDDVAELLAALLTEVDRDRETYRVLLADPAAFGEVRAALEQWVGTRITAAVPDADPVAVAFVAGGVARVVGAWLEESTPGRDVAPVDEAIRRMAGAVLQLR